MRKFLSVLIVSTFLNACGQAGGGDIEIPPGENQLSVKCYAGNCPQSAMLDAVAGVNETLGVELLVYQGNVQPGEPNPLYNGVIPVLEVIGTKTPYHIKDTPGWGISYPSASFQDVTVLEEGLLAYLEKFYF